MAQIIVRNLEEGLKAQLAMYAKQHGHSMEEEVRQIIRNSLSRRKSGFGTRVAKRFAKSGLENELPRLPVEPLRNPFSE
jgi:plasmid stability protein